jgi:hypothetical protein
MIIDFTSLNASDYAAWWGAIIASLAFLWNIVVAVRSGARLKVSVSPNMELYPPNPGEEGQTYIFVKAVNKGNSATTITHFCGFTTKSQFDRFRKKVKPFIVGINGKYQPLPFKLEPGEEWVGIANQDDILMREKLLYLGVIHNQKEKPIYKQVQIST